MADSNAANGTDGGTAGQIPPPPERWWTETRTTLIAAILAALFSIGGAGLSTYGAIRASSISVEATNSQRIIEQRQVTYTAFLTIVREIRDSVERRAILSQGDTETPGMTVGKLAETLNKQNEELLNHSQKMSGQVASLKLWAGGESLSTGMTLSNAVQELLTFATRDVVRISPWDEYKAAFAKIDDAEGRFLLAARAELGVPVG
jgi:hypothetical protein